MSEGTEKNGIWSYIELSVHKAVNVVHLKIAGLSTEWDNGTRRDIQTRKGACQGFGSYPAQGDSHSGCDFMVVGKRPKHRLGGIQTHILEGISWVHVRESKRDQEVHSNSQTGWDFKSARQLT